MEARLLNHLAQCAAQENAEATVQSVPPKLIQREFVQATNLDKKQPDVWNNLALLYMQIGQYDGGRRILEAITKHFHTYDDATNNYGNCLLHLNQLSEATRAYQTVIFRDNFHLEALNNYGVLLMKQKFYTYAADVLEKAAEVDASKAFVWSNLACAYSGAGRYPEAWQAFKKALLIEEDNGRVKCNMAHHITAVLQMENDASGRREKYQEAENIYTQVLQDEHYKCAQAWSGLATLYNAESEFTHDNYKENKLREMATEAFSHAIDLAPHDAVVWTQLGLLSVAQADYAKAEEYLRTVLEKNRNIMTAWCNLGITLQLADRLDEAVRTYNKALELMPRAYQIYNNLGNVFRQQSTPREVLLLLLTHNR